MNVGTLFVTDALINVTCGLMCLMLWNNQRADYCLAWWGAGFTLFGLIDAVYPFSATNPVINSVGYSVLDIATLAIWFGFRSFDGKPAVMPLLFLIPPMPAISCLAAGWLLGNWVWANNVGIFMHCGVAIAQATMVLKGSTSATGPRSICAYAIYVIAGSIAIPMLADGLWLAKAQNDAFILIVDHAMTIVITLSVIGMVGTRDFSAVLWASRHDALTGLLNRKGFIEAVTSVDADQAVLMMDLDHFKSINDRFGHEGGDDVLRCFAHRVSRTVGESGVFARLGGEEFVVVSKSRSVDEADCFAEAVRIDASGQPVQSGEHSIPFTVSIGVAICNAEDDPFKAIRRADEALYRAKANGRNCVAHHADNPDHRIGDIPKQVAGRRAARRDLCC